MIIFDVFFSHKIKTTIEHNVLLQHKFRPSLICLLLLTTFHTIDVNFLSLHCLLIFHNKTKKATSSYTAKCYVCTDLCFHFSHCALICLCIYESIGCFVIVQITL